MDRFGRDKYSDAAVYLNEVTRRAAENPFRPRVDLDLNLITSAHRIPARGSRMNAMRARKIPPGSPRFNLIECITEDNFYFDDDFDDLTPMTCSSVSQPKTGFLGALKKEYPGFPTFLYMSGLLSVNGYANGRYELITDDPNEPVLQHGKPQYRRALEDQPDKFMYIQFIHLDDQDLKWELVENDRRTLLAYCRDDCLNPCECANFWYVSSSGKFDRDPTVKVCREPTLFLQRIAVFKSLDKMLEDFEYSDIEKAVKPAAFYRVVIKRDKLVKSSLQTLLVSQASDLVARDFKIRFENELGLDYGAITKEWFHLLSEGLMSVQDLELELWDRKVRTNGNLFVHLSDNTLLPVGTAPLEFYVAIGRALAMALFHKAFFPLPLNLVVYKYILEMPITADDIQNLDPDFFQHRLWTLAQPGGSKKIADMLGEPLTFVSAASGGSMGGVPLIPDGDKIKVTEDNKMWYVRYVSIEYLCGDIDKQLQALVSGFWGLCPRKALRHMQDAADLQALIQGPKEPLDVNRLKMESQFSPGGNKAHMKYFEWFFRMLWELTPEVQARFLQFATGSSRIPTEGLKPAFTLVINSSHQNRLPISHTCSNMISIPAYHSYEVMVAKCRLAFDFHSGFGFE